jgi:UMF1 family MFS transporter
MSGLSKAAKAWCTYDIANSVYATSVMTFIFPIFFKAALVGDARPWGMDPAAVLPLLTSVSLLLVFIGAPLLGSLADQKAWRKSLLAFFTVVGSLCTASLGLIPNGHWEWASLAFVLANASFVMATLFYNALLKVVATEEQLPKISGLGWGIGYAGGFLALAMHLILIQGHEMFGLDKGTATRIAIFSSGIWWALFAIPLLLWVPEGEARKDQNLPWYAGFKAIPGVIMTPLVGVFLISFFFYNDAVQTTISQAANLANGLLGIGIDKVLMVGVVIQLVAIIGSYGFVMMERIWGTKRVLVGSLINWCLILIWAWFMNTMLDFWILGIWVGLVMGVSQSASRTLMAQLTPADRSAEFFSVFSLADRGGAMLGPLMFSLAVQAGDIRYGILPILASMLLGTLLLAFKVRTSRV